jgi:hypothetical protein
MAGDLADAFRVFLSRGSTSPVGILLEVDLFSTSRCTDWTPLDLLIISDSDFPTKQKSAAVFEFCELHESGELERVLQKSPISPGCS